ncbi:MAG: slipin family protein [Leptolyngbya sp. RL_3_1]|nr:slipin family protein [Leptolyngbya sp. RL_3_1]
MVMRITIFEYERGLKYVKGRFKQVLPPGQYWVGLLGNTTIRKVDIRPQYISIPGQAVLTADGVGLKVSLTAVYEISDPAAAINQVSNYYQALYLTVQTALRETVEAIAIDALMANRAQLNGQLLTSCADPVAAIGLRLISVSLKDLMLPGELKKLYAQVVQARQAGLAQLERARGETAALRNLANAARLTHDNPALLKLRLLQALEQSSGNTFFIGTAAMGEPSHDNSEQL